MSSSAAEFRYRAATSDGRLVDGTLAATSERAALAALEERELVPVELVRAQTGGTRAVRGGRATLRAATAAWARTMSTLLGAGITLERALAFTGEHASHPRVASAARTVQQEIQRGASASAAMRAEGGVFSPIVVAMIAAGEEAGALDAAFARVATYLEEQESLRQQLRAALSYPALLSVVAGASVLVLMLVVVPRFAQMLSDMGGTLPLSTRLLLGVSEMGMRWGWLLAIGALGAIAVARTALRDPARRQRWHATRLRLPVTGPIEEALETARFLRTLATLLDGGAAVLPALRGARAAVQNASLGSRLDQAIEDVRRGRTIAAAFGGILPPLALELVAAGEESGTLAALALQAGSSAADEAQRSLRRLVSFVEPALILVFGLLVGFVALAMLQAIYSVNAATIIR